MVFKYILIFVQLNTVIDRNLFILQKGNSIPLNNSPSFFLPSP